MSSRASWLFRSAVNWERVPSMSYANCIRTFVKISSQGKMQLCYRFRSLYFLRCHQTGLKYVQIHYSGKKNRRDPLQDQDAWDQRSLSDDSIQTTPSKCQLKQDSFTGGCSVISNKLLRRKQWDLMVMGKKGRIDIVSGSVEGRWYLRTGDWPRESWELWTDCVVIRLHYFLTSF